MSKSKPSKLSRPLRRTATPNLERLESREVPTISVSPQAQWNDVGPSIISNGQSTNIAGSNPVIGAISALAPHPTNPNIMIAGAPNGGVWRTFNALSAAPNWEPIGDSLGSLSVSDIAFDPSDPNRLLVGIGRTADGVAEDQAMDSTRNGVRGDLVGAYLTENALAVKPSWRQIGGALIGKNVTNVVLRPSYMVVGTDQGVFYSSNNGVSFTNTFAVSRDNGITFPTYTFTGKVYDIATNPRLPNQLYLAVVGQGSEVFRSDNGGQSWGSVTDDQMQLNSRTVNVKLDVRDVGEFENQVYVTVSNDFPVQENSTQQSTEDHLVTPPIPPGTDLTYFDQWRGSLQNATFGYTRRQAVIVSICWSTNQGGNWTRMDAPKRAMAPIPIDRITTSPDGFIRIIQDPAVSIFLGRTLSEHTRLRDGDVVRISGVVDTGDPPNPVLTADYFVRIVDDFTFDLVDETYAPGIGYIPADANPPFADIPLPGFNPTYRRLVNANPGEDGEFLEIVADPSSQNTVYIGGDSTTRDFYTTAATGPTTYESSLWRGNRFTSAAKSNKGVSTQWTSMNGTGNSATNSPAADTREMVFDSAGNLWMATGGGIYRKSSPSTNTPWVSVSSDIKVTQFWSTNLSTASGTISGGTQDTGMITQLAGGNSTYTQLLTTAQRNKYYDQMNAYSSDVDNVTFPGQSVQYFASKDFAAVIRRVVNADGSIASTTPLIFASPALTGAPLAGIVPADLYEGITDADPDNDPLNQRIAIQIKLNLNDRRRGIYGRTQVYEDSDPAGVTGAIVNNITPTGMTGHVTGFMYGGFREGIPFNQVLYVGTSTGQLWVRGEFGTTFVDRAPAGPGSITQVVRDEDDWRNVYVLKGGRIFNSTNAGITWTDLTGNLLGAVDPATGGPVTGTMTTEVRAIALWDPNPGTAAGGVVLLAGGRGGVYRKSLITTCPDNAWGEYGQGLPNTVVTDLEFQGDQLVAGTFGRGAWYIPDVRPTLGNPITVTVSSDVDNAQLSITADPTNPNNFIVSDGVNALSLANGTIDRVVFNPTGINSTVLVDSNGNLAGGSSRFLKVNVEANFGGLVGSRLLINNESDTLNEIVTVTNSSVGGFPGDNFFFSGCVAVTYNGLQTGRLDIISGSKNDLVNVGSLGAGRTALYDSGGNESIIVSAPSGVLDIMDTIGSNRLFDVGAATDDRYTVSDGGYSRNSVLNVNYFGNVSQTNINGGTGNNSISVVDTNAIATGYVVNHTGTYGGSVTGLNSILNYSNVQDLSVVGNTGSDSVRWLDYSRTRYGTAGNPAAGLVYTPISATAGRMTVNSGAATTLNFVGLNGSFSVNGDFNVSGQADTISVIGVTTATLIPQYGEILSPDGVDTITATDTSVSVVNNYWGQLKPIFLEKLNSVLHSFANVIVRAGDEVFNGDIVTATPTISTNLLLDGGLPAPGAIPGSVPGDRLIINTTNTYQLFPSTDPNLGPAQTRLRENANSAQLGYFNFESDPSFPPPVPQPPPPPKPAQIFAVGSEAGVPATVKVYNAQTGALRYQLQPFGGSFNGGARVATGDINGDGFEDFVVSAGAGGGPRVIVYNGTTGAVLRDFLAYESGMNKGTYIAVGDVNANGFGDIVVSTGAGTSPRVRVYDGAANALLTTFAPYAGGFTGGVRVAAGDVNGDGAADIVTGAGPGGGPHVQVFNGKNNSVIQSFMAYTPTFSLGIYVAAGDIDGDGKADIITGPDVGGGAHVQVFQGLTSTPIRGFFVGEPTVPNQQPISVGSGVRVAARDIDGDGVVEILTGRGRGVRPLAQMIRVSSRNAATGVVTATLSTPLSVNAFGDAYLDGIFVG